MKKKWKHTAQAMEGYIAWNNISKDEACIMFKISRTFLDSILRGDRSLPIKSLKRTMKFNFPESEYDFIESYLFDIEAQIRS